MASEHREYAVVEHDGSTWPMRQWMAEAVVAVGPMCTVWYRLVHTADDGRVSYGDWHQVEVTR